MSKTVATLRSEIVDICRDGYYVPRGFLDEEFETSLHLALRELRSEGAIKLWGREAGFECWRISGFDG